MGAEGSTASGATATRLAGIATRSQQRDPGHYRLRYDHVDPGREVSIRRAGKMHRLGIGKRHRGTQILAIADDQHHPVFREFIVAPDLAEVSGVVADTAARVGSADQVVDAPVPGHQVEPIHAVRCASGDRLGQRQDLFDRLGDFLESPLGLVLSLLGRRSRSLLRSR
jgi:hypothetical protein